VSASDRAAEIASELTSRVIERTSVVMCPDAAGFYAWWVPDAVASEFQPSVPLAHPAGCEPGWTLLYVGISPDKRDGTGTVRSRVHSHRTGLVNRSTIRYTIAALHPELRLGAAGTTSNGRKPLLANEQDISDWIDSKTGLTYSVEPFPWTAGLERAVIGKARPPLNCTHSLHPFKTTVSEARASLLADCRRLDNLASNQGSSTPARRSSQHRLE
jgi:hypothetical protein